MKKLLRKIIGIAVLCSIAVIGFKIFVKPKEVKLGEPFELGVGRVVFADVQMKNTNYVLANPKSKDFLTPISRDDLNIGDHFLHSKDEDDGVIVLTLIVENIGKRDWVFKPWEFEVNYDDGYKYSSDTGYVQYEEVGWQAFDEITLEKLKSAVEIRIAFWVPSVVIESNAPLTLEYWGFTCQIR